MKTLYRWLPLAFIVTSLCGIIYLADQQILRIGANDPQIQMSEDIANTISRGGDVYSLVSTNTVDIAASLSPFIIIYNKEEPIASNATLDGKTPQLPPGVLIATTRLAQDRFTWQPRPGVRIATVITPFSNKQQSGFVLVGRSLREIEKRIDQLTFEVGVAWVVTMIGSLIAMCIFPPVV